MIAAFCADRKLDSMYFIAHGRVHIRTANGYLLDILNDGQYFGGSQQ